MKLPISADSFIKQADLRRITITFKKGFCNQALLKTFQFPGSVLCFSLNILSCISSSALQSQTSVVQTGELAASRRKPILRFFEVCFRPFAFPTFIHCKSVQADYLIYFIFDRLVFLIEVFFSIPGLGREILTAVNRSDYPVIQAATVYLAALTMVINLITDVLYKFVDPRVTLK